jgi:hypothetical protein
MSVPSKLITQTKRDLTTIKKKLQQLQTTPDGFLHIQPLQNQLDEIDSNRVDGKFGGVTNDKRARFQTPVDNGLQPGQAELSSLLEECYTMVNEIINSGKADRASLQAELLDIKSELSKLNNMSIPANMDLIPLQERLSFVEQRRINGQFLNQKGEAPLGQAVLHELLAECHEMKERIQVKAQ